MNVLRGTVHKMTKSGGYLGRLCTMRYDIYLSRLGGLRGGLLGARCVKEKNKGNKKT